MPYYPQAGGGAGAAHDHTAGDGGLISGGGVDSFLEFTDQGSDPSAPSAGFRRLYGKAGGLYVRDPSAIIGALGAAAAGGGAGPGIIQEWAGYNVAGATWVAMTQGRIIAKKVTLANDCLLTDIEVHIRETTNDASSGLCVALYDDAGGSPNNVIQQGYVNLGLLMDDTSGAGGNQTARWWGQPIGRWCPAGDYWLAVMCTTQQTASIEIAMDGSGTDKYHGSGGLFIGDWGFQATTTTTDTYSIRANTVRGAGSADFAAARVFANQSFR